MDEIYLGLMSGTSLDAVDAVAVLFNAQGCQLLATHSVDLPLSLRADISICASRFSAFARSFFISTPIKNPALGGAGGG